MSARVARTAMALLLALAWGSATANEEPVRAWVSRTDGSKRLQRLPLESGPGDRQVQPIHVDPDRRYQRIVGFGAALTDSSAWLLQHRLAPQSRQALLRELFGRDDGGLGLSLMRLTIGASDFSPRHYSLDDPADGRPDPTLAYFDVAPNRDAVIPLARAMLAINPELKFIASPWSAPAWMKDSANLVGGTLLPRYYPAFAHYLLRYVRAYRVEGIPIFALTVQNEPDFEPPDYPGMRLNAAARARLIGDHLGPLLATEPQAPQLLDWDHNWNRPEEPLAVLADAKAGRYVAGVAWHCYAGQPAAQGPVHDAFPDKDAYMTECSGGDWEPIGSGGLPLLARRMLIEPLRHWARGVVLWNLALDPRGGPHTGGCGTCRGLVTLDTGNGSVHRNDEYYALGHASRFLPPGAWRIESGPEPPGLAQVAFLDPGNGQRVLLLANEGDQPRRIEVIEGARRFQLAIPPSSLVTVVWPGPG